MEKTFILGGFEFRPSDGILQRKVSRLGSGELNQVSPAAEFFTDFMGVSSDVETFAAIDPKLYFWQGQAENF